MANKGNADLTSMLARIVRDRAWMHACNVTLHALESFYCATNSMACLDVAQAARHYAAAAKQAAIVCTLVGISKTAKIWDGASDGE